MTAQSELIAELRTSLDSIFERFRKENASVNVQAQLDRWRTDARKKIKLLFGDEESDTFNGISLSVGFGAGLYENQEDMTLDYIQRAAAYFEALEGSIVPGDSGVNRPKAAAPDSKKVFVVHGRNDALNRALYSFLRSLKLDPIQWENAVSLIGGSPYVGEVIVEGMKQAQAVVILLTPDEQVTLRPELAHGSSDPDLASQFQPRPNVIFEAGIALALDEKRSILVEVGTQRSFSDIFGRHLIRLDNTAAKRNALAGRLRTAGCAVETDGNHWLDEGDFSCAPEPTPQKHEMQPEECISLTEAEDKIIKHLAGKKRSVKRDLINVVKESEVRLDYYLNRLQKKGYVGAILSMAGDPAQYMLYEAGTKYAVENLGL